MIAFDGYLEALRVPLVAGRTFTTADETQPVVIVDERLARDAWPNQSAIGQRLALMSNISGPRWVGGHRRGRARRRARGRGRPVCRRSG